MCSYTVRATFDDRAVARQWIDWLRDEHLRDVCEAGAFEQYERDHAPRLRKEGLKRFPPGRGIGYERAIGEVACEYASVSDA